MLTKLIDKSDAAKVVAREEDHFLDFKSASVKGAALQKIATAFANADGGEILIGIEDPAVAKGSARWAGCSTVEDFNPHLQALSEVRPQLPMSLGFLACEGLSGIVLHVSIEKSSQVHQTASGDVYVRRGAQSLPLNDAEQLIALKFAKGLSSFEDTAVSNVPPEVVVDSPELHKFLTTFSPKSEPLDYVVNENLLDLRTWDPKVSGLVLFAKNPSAFIPTRAGVRVTRYETKEDDPERDHLAGSELIEAPAYELIHTVVARVAHIMSSISIWTVDGLKRVEYPPEAIWEIVVNAIIHRDYSVADDVQVRVFDNRIEVQSPGRLPAFVRVENILDVRYSRNKQVVRTLARYPEPPNRDMGEGLNTAFQKMKEWKLKAPLIEEQENSVLVTIPHAPLAKPEEIVMEFLRRNGLITNRQARELTGIRSENAMKNVFYSLRDAGWIEMIPRGNKTEWKLIAE